MPEKYAVHPQKNTHADVQIQRPLGGNNTEITGLHKRSPWNPPHTSRGLPNGNFEVNTSDLSNILDTWAAGYYKFLH